MKYSGCAEAVQMPKNPCLKDSLSGISKFQETKDCADILTPQKRGFCSDSYCTFDILPEDELSYIKSSFEDLKEGDFDAAAFVFLTGCALSELRVEKTARFYEIISELYKMHEKACTGRGGFFISGGDYLTFSDEPVKVKLYIPKYFLKL